VVLLLVHMLLLLLLLLLLLPMLLLLLLPMLPLRLLQLLLVRHMLEMVPLWLLEMVLLWLPMVCRPRIYRRRGTIGPHAPMRRDTVLSCRPCEATEQLAARKSVSSTLQTFGNRTVKKFTKP
jgi:hypothetical protein